MSRSRADLLEPDAWDGPQHFDRVAQRVYASMLVVADRFGVPIGFGSGEAWARFIAGRGMRERMLAVVVEYVRGEREHGQDVLDAMARLNMEQM